MRALSPKGLAQVTSQIMEFNKQLEGATMKTELQLLTDEQLLTEIKRQWYEIGLLEFEALVEHEEWTVATDYMASDIEQHIERLEKEYKSRGFELPNRAEYVAQFEPDEDEPYDGQPG